MAEWVMLHRCQRFLDLVIQGKQPPSFYCRVLREFAAVLDGLGSISIDLLEGVANLESKAMHADNIDAAVCEETFEVMGRVSRRVASSGLSSSMFAPAPSKLSRKQHELSNWLTPSFRMDVTPKEVWLRDVNSCLVAVRWLSFRAELRTNPGPLSTLAEAVARCHPKKKRRKIEEDDEEQVYVEEEQDEETHHYDLMQALCTHAASGQPGIDLKRLRRAASNGEDISVLMDGKMTALEMKRFLNKEITGSSFQKLMAVAEEIEQLLAYMLKCDRWTGRQTGALIFAHLLFCIEVGFTNGKVEQLTVAPGFPTFCGSKEPMLELYDRNKLYHGRASDPDFVFGTAPSDGFKGLVKLVSSICSTNGVPVAPLRFVTDEGIELNVAVGEDLVYNGRNSVVLSCRAHDEDRASSVLKVAPECDSRREERYHGELDNLAGVRRMESSGYVHGAGIGLRFIQLAHYANAFRPAHVAGDRARKFAEQACATVQGMHERRVLHRDIKPDNFILVSDTLLLNDFDLSCDLADEEQRCFIAGTPMFTSPRLTDGVVYDTVDDWMSLGLTFMYLLDEHRSEATKVSSLTKIASAAWAPDVLKSNVAAGLRLMELQKANIAENMVNYAEQIEDKE